MQEIDFAQLEQKQKKAEKAEKAAVTITYDLPKIDEKLNDGQSVSVSIDVSFSVQFRPAQF